MTPARQPHPPLPPPGEHGGDGPALAAALGVPPAEVLDLSASLNPVAPPIAPLVRRVAEAASRYPDAQRARPALAEAIGVERRRLLLTNGASEAIALVASELGEASLAEPEFSAWRRHLAAVVPTSAKRVRSNPNNPTGALAASTEAADAWDEAFYQLATGTWTRGDADKGAFVIGSLTKLFSCPGLRLGYVVAPDEPAAERLARHQPLWPVNALALEALPLLLSSADLPKWAAEVALLRSELAAVFSRAGFRVFGGPAPWVLVEEAAWLRPALARQAVAVRDCANFGLPGYVRVAVPGPSGLERLERALARALSSELSPSPQHPQEPGLPALAPQKAGLPAATRQESGLPAVVAEEPARRERVAHVAVRRSLPVPLRGALLVCGTASDVGKSRLVAGLCRALARRGVKVAPFKAQNMSLNSTVTAAGHEIARSQAAQAAAARAEADVLMGPVLLKPTGETTSQLVVMGRPAGEVTFGAGQRPGELLEQVVLPALAELRQRFEVVIAEGAGGAGEVNLLAGDIANLPLARRASLPAVLVADIERGGALAAVLGTQALVPEELRGQLKGFIINKFRGQRALLQPGIDELERRSGMACLGVLPHLGRLSVDEEDSLALARAPWKGLHQQSPLLDVAVIGLPHMANFTDFSPLEMEPTVAVRYVGGPGELGCPDLVVLPGSKMTAADLSWLRQTGLAAALLAARSCGTALLGVCAGYQMLGQTITDHIESKEGVVAGLGVLPVVTEFAAAKTTRWRYGKALGGEAVTGFEIHHGQVRRCGPAKEWFWLEAPSGPEGVADAKGGVWATSLHGLFENDELRSSFLAEVARRRGKAFRSSGLAFTDAREEMFELLADTVESHLDLEALFALASGGRPAR